MTEGQSSSVTIVIPTRNRRVELLATVESALASTHPDLKVRVFDNHSTDGTREAVLERFGDRVEYLRAARPLAMVDSFEAAYSCVATDWVLGLGADDGLLPSAVSRLLQGALDADARSAISLRAAYFYPGVLHASPGGRLRVPAVRPDTVVRSKDVASSVLRGRTKWYFLPSGYFGLLRSDVLDDLRRSHGRVFTSLTPDVGMNFAVSREIDRHAIIGEPLLVAGASPFSNGASQFGLTAGEGIESFWIENDQSTVVLHPSFSAVDQRLPASMRAICLEAFLQSGRPEDALVRFLTSPLVQCALAALDRAEPAEWWDEYANKNIRRRESRVVLRTSKTLIRSWHSTAWLRGYARAATHRTRRAVGVPAPLPQRKFAFQADDVSSLDDAIKLVQDFLARSINT